MPQRGAAFALAVIGLFGFTATATAQPYPGRTVTIVCPYPAGGPTDQTARVIADFLSKKFNQSFIVENVTGGGTTVATNRVTKASPDGYTLLLHNLQISANATLYKNVPFDTEKDLTGIMLIIGLGTRVSLLVQGLLFIALTVGLVLIDSNDGVAFLGIHIGLVAAAFLLVQHNRFAVLKKW